MSNTLRIPLKKKYFDAINAGTKIVEYRLCNSYWSKRLVNRHYDWIVLTCGYPKKTDKHRHIRKKYYGYAIRKMQHVVFGKNPVMVFVIFLKRQGV